MLGFKIIKEMDKHEIIEELLESHRQHLETQELDPLKVALINMRTELFRKRSITEAGMKGTGSSFLGMTIVETDDD